jgi:hypothetical protein
MDIVPLSVWGWSLEYVCATVKSLWALRCSSRALRMVVDRCHCMHCGRVASGLIYKGQRAVHADRHIELCTYPDELDPYRFVYASIKREVRISLNASKITRRMPAHVVTGRWAVFLHHHEHRLYVDSWIPGSGKACRQPLRIWFHATHGDRYQTQSGCIEARDRFELGWTVPDDSVKCRGMCAPKMRVATTATVCCGRSLDGPRDPSSCSLCSRGTESGDLKVRTSDAISDLTVEVRVAGGYEPGLITRGWVEYVCGFPSYAFQAVGFVCRTDGQKEWSFTADHMVSVFIDKTPVLESPTSLRSDIVHLNSSDYLYEPYCDEGRRPRCSCPGSATIGTVAKRSRV